MLMAFFSWWYGEGWRRQVSRATTRIDNLLDFFSFELLLRTLFAPFRQISAGQVSGPLAVQWRAFVDLLVSRCIGAMVRLAVLLAGVVALLLSGVFAVAHLLVWPLLPLAPIVGTMCALTGWVPWR